MTDGLAYLAAVVLAVVFAYSALTKFRDAQPTRRALAAAGFFGAGAIVKVLAGTEALTAVLLLTVPSAGALLGIGLLALFTGFIAFLLMRKIDVSCGCFGANASEPVSSVDIVRNIFLLVLAAVALSQSRPAAVSIEEVIVASTAVAIAAVALAALSTRKKLGQLFDNRLPGGL